MTAETTELNAEELAALNSYIEAYNNGARASQWYTGHSSQEANVLMSAIRKTNTALNQAAAENLPPHQSRLQRQPVNRDLIERIRSL